MARSLFIEFSVADRKVTPLRAKPMRRRAKESLPLDAGELTGTFWVELLDAQNKAVYRRALHDPFAEESVVCFPAGADSGFRAEVVSNPDHDGVGQVLVPVEEQAAVVAFFAGADHHLVGRMELAALTGSLVAA